MTAAASIGRLSAAFPAALMPLRLETRFAKDRSRLQLLIRAYPDQIHQDTHEPELTDAEREWGEHFWVQQWRAGGDGDREREAWAQLAARFGAPRAAWIARVLRPDNMADRPNTPVADSDELNPAPAFPATAQRDSSWTRAPHARLLPDQLVAVGYRGGQRLFEQWGAAIPPTLATGPSPAHSVATLPSGLAVDAAMRWMVDFDEAVKVGMGIRVRNVAGLAQGLDELYVLGLQSEDPGKTAAQLDALLSAHQYTDGLELLDPATPTNNGVDQRTPYVARAAPAPSAWLADDPRASAPQAGSDGAALTGALSLGPDALLDILGASAHSTADAGAMLSVLWPALGGYALEQLVGGALSEPARRGIAEHAEQFVRAGGPLPVMRVGSQPYGVLPVAPLPGMLEVGASTGRRRAVDVLQALRPFWEGSLPHVPRLGGGDPDAELLAAMGMDARATSFAARPFTGPRYLDDLIDLLGGPTEAQTKADVNARRAALAQLLQQIGVGGGARVGEGFYATTSALLLAPVLQEDPLSATDEVKPQYLKWLLGAVWTDVLAGHDSRGQPLGDQRKPLLFVIARAALLLELAGAAFDALAAQTPPAVAAGDRIEPELVDATARTPLWRLRQQLAHPPTPPLGEALWPAPRPALGPPAAAVRTYRERLGALSRLPSATLDRLFRDTLDVHAHRLDAWITSLATRRLAEVRSAEPTGLHAGAFGWLTDLHPHGTPAAIGSSTPSPQADPAGYVHAPSIAHAVTAAVLRGGQLAHAGQGPGKMLAVDLSSRRVREADAVLDGLRQGQSLGALLGYRFERALHDATDSGGARLDGYIPAFRALAPQTAGKLLPAARPVGAGTAPGVVDGMALVRRYQNGPALPWGQQGLPPATGADHEAIVAALDGLVEIADALSDATVAESLYHAVQGNPLRSGASLEALDRGEAPPPEMEFTHPPRSGVAVAHRVGVLRSAANADPTAGVDGWAPAAPRGQAEPVLSELCAQWLPAPGAVRWQVRYDGTGPATSFWQTFSLADLDVGALDVVYGTVAGSDPAASELEARALDAARAAHPEFTGDITLVADRDPTWGASVFTLPELADLAGALRALLTGARALAPRDLVGPASTPAGIDAQALADQRVTPATTGLTSAISALGGVAASSDLGALRGALLHLSGYGIGSAVPASLDAGALQQQAARAVAEGQARVDAAAGAIAGLDTSDPTAPTTLTAALRAVFGSGFLLAPPFTAPAGIDFTQSASLLDGGVVALEDWAARIARVREGMHRLSTALLDAACAQPLAGRGKAGAFAVAQLPPPEPAERWVALPTIDGAPPPGGRISFVFEGAGGVDLSGEIAGLLVDDWVEVVPSERETTALAFGYDAPVSTAPQAILLALAPATATHWSLAALEDVAREALSLSRLRMVDPEALQGLGHLLPSLFLADNDAQETISTNLFAETSR